MKKTSILFGALLIMILSSCKDEKKKEEARLPEQYDLEDFYNTKSISASGFNDDETKILINNNTTGIYNAYELSLADTTAIALTKSTKESIYTVDYLPGSSKFIYSADEGGNENSHLFLMDRKSSTPKDITPWANSANSFNGWSQDKKSMYINSNKRDVKYFDILKLDTLTWKPTILYQNESGLTPSVISKTERYIALTKEITTDKNEMYLYDSKTKTTKRLSNDKEANWSPMAFEKNDSIFYYTSNEDKEFSSLLKYNINTGKSEEIFKDKWDVMYMSLSEKEKYHIVFVNNDGKNKVLLFEHATGKPLKLPDFDDGDVINVIISNSENKLLLTVGSSTSSPNLYLYDIPSKKLKQLTSTLSKKINQDDLAKAEVIRFKSFDGKEIPAIYYKPLQASKNNKVPALIWVHGGPGGQSRIGYSNTIQYLVNKGYAVLAVNNRGSSGYGKTFYKMDNKDHSNGDLKDCIWGKKWLTEQDYIDPNAIGIYGGSYGGCMVLGALAFHPEEFKVGIDLFGVANWPRTLKSIPPYWESFRKALYDEMGDPYTADSIRLKKISPLYNYDKINKPLLVFQGANDVRVLPVESDEIVEGVKKNGVPVQYVVYPDEGHGFQKKENQIATTKTTLLFLDKYLKSKK
ncbi:prolyl oligopeptidase family serine peptidase [Flavobacterium sp. XS2P24]|uniref:S9 family peptidase n=1 Tax=Flavobacterium sp. XS2P24 TaxID=3041249 RepID=UPI0024A907D5|nr:alpha/beta fold hydrolase [Flavobacterium sp. XS2P24]MDI6049518.1 prolyl oligopeptidase family serine peptidase [Flavobacterium sp. XS2P24]